MKISFQDFRLLHGSSPFGSEVFGGRFETLLTFERRLDAIARDTGEEEQMPESVNNKALNNPYRLATISLALEAGWVPDSNNLSTQSKLAPQFAGPSSNGANKANRRNSA